MSEWLFQSDAQGNFSQDVDQDPNVGGASALSGENDPSSLAWADGLDEEPDLALMNWDTGWDGGGGDTPPPPPPPPPSSGPFDYSDLPPFFDVATWQEWVTGQAPSPGYTWTSPGYDSLAPYLGGDWTFDIDPELLEWEGGFGDGVSEGGGPGYNYGNQSGAATSWGVPNGRGGIMPIGREWMERIGGSGLDSTFVLHREVFGYYEARTFNVSTGSDPWSYWQRGDTALNLFDLAGIYQNFTEAMSPASNTLAISSPIISLMTGLPTAEVRMPDGTWIGNVTINEFGFYYEDRHGNRSDFIRPLEQHWTLGGAAFQEQKYHGQRTMSLPFATAMIEMGGLAMSGMMRNWAQGEGFDVVLGWINGGLTGQGAAAQSRFMEAAYELRQWYLRNY